MAIKQYISLEGAEKMIADMKRAQVAGEQMLASFRTAGQQFIPVDAFSNSIGQASQATRQLTSSTQGLTAAYHLLHPILGAAGIEIGNFRAFTVLAHESVGLLAVAIGGAIVIGAAKAAEALDNLKRSMAFLFGAQGVTAVNALGTSLEGLGASAEQLAPALTSAEQILQRISAFKGISLGGAVTFGSPEQQKLVTDAIATLERQLEVLGKTSAEATPEINRLFQSLNQFDPKTGRNIGLTAQAFEELRRTAPEVAKFIGDALQKNLGGDIFERLRRGPIDFITLMRAIAAQMAETFAKPLPDNVSQSFDLLKKSVIELLATLGELGATEFFRNLAAGIRDLRAQFAAIDFGPLRSLIATTEQELNGLNQAAQSFGKSIHDALAQPITIAPEQLGIGVFDALAQNFQQTLDQLKAGAQSTWAVIQQIFSDGTQQLQADIRGIDWTGIWQTFISAAQSAFQAVLSAWQSTAAQFQAPQFGPGAPSFAEFAGGGLIHGPGTTTSDSIIARLSNLEYVMRASAVKFYGVDVMHALNAMRLPRDFFRGFNLGGLVLPPFPAPAFAQGGLVSGGQQRSLTLVLDGKSFAMAGSKNVVDDLERAADLHNLSRIGKAPGWIR